MNYGYDRDSGNWKPERMQQLGDKLRAYINGEDFPLDKYGFRPYVEVEEWTEDHDGDEYPTTLYPGVRVRRITHYDLDTLEVMVTEFDRIYDEVMA